MQITMMDLGRQALTAVLSGGPAPIVASYDIGTDYGFIPDSSKINVSPLPPIFSGLEDTIYKTIVTPDEMIFTIYLPYDLSFHVGNALLRLSNGVPFLWLVMDEQFIKIGMEPEKHYAGDIYLLSFVVKYPGISTKMNLANLPDFYAQAPPAIDITNMTDVFHAPADQQQLDNSTYLLFNKGRPVYMTIGGEQWWGTPFMMASDDIRAWELDGGNAGDGYVYTPQLTGSR